MSRIRQFHQYTIELIKLLEDSKVNRDEKINQVERLLSQREGLINQIIPPYTPEEVEVGEKMNQLNFRLLQLLLAEKASVQKDIKGLQTKKETNNKYVNPYQDLSTDGMFYDKRK